MIKELKGNLVPRVLSYPSPRREPGNEVNLRDGATSSQPRLQGLLAFQYDGGRRAAILESEKTLGTRLWTESWIFGILSVP